MRRLWEMSFGKDELVGPAGGSGSFGWSLGERLGSSQNHGSRVTMRPWPCIFGEELLDISLDLVPAFGEPAPGSSRGPEAIRLILGTASGCPTATSPVLSTKHLLETRTDLREKAGPCCTLVFSRNQQTEEGTRQQLVEVSADSLAGNHRVMLAVCHAPIRRVTREASTLGSPESLYREAGGFISTPTSRLSQVCSVLPGGADLSRGSGFENQRLSVEGRLGGGAALITGWDSLALPGRGLPGRVPGDPGDSRASKVGTGPQARPSGSLQGESKTGFRCGKVTACGCGRRSVADASWGRLRPGEGLFDSSPGGRTAQTPGLLSTKRKCRASKAENVKCMM
ncbi:hypothetical protein J1605_005751 [Eschrichtius robustus]|uniref:Uncharacterized protein n=1 Tax=Eschrichtius robustus TaxID=9764 RepID=A0AB34H3J1_ESCRO|nr:hypothetical protein J1605_005751 [Eschrichtius robustus]